MARQATILGRSTSQRTARRRRCIRPPHVCFRADASCLTRGLPRLISLPTPAEAAAPRRARTGRTCALWDPQGVCAFLRIRRDSHPFIETLSMVLAVGVVRCPGVLRLWDYTRVLVLVPAFASLCQAETRRLAGHSSLVIGRSSLITGHRSLITTD